MIYLALCAIFQNESRFLREWIEYYRLVGVEKFFLFNHLSTDNYLEVLEPYIRQGIVQIEDITKVCTTPESFEREIHLYAYNKIIREQKNNVRWLICLDTDEFFVPVEHKNLVEFLKLYESYGGVVANWIVYGTSNIERLNDQQLLIEHLNYRSHLDNGINRHVKSIIQPARVIKFANPHFAIYFKPYYGVDENFQPVNKPFNSVAINKIRINHYLFRDNDFCYNVKLPRSLKLNYYSPERIKNLEEEIRSTNLEEDKIIHRFLPELKERLGKPVSIS